MKSVHAAKHSQAYLEQLQPSPIAGSILAPYEVQKRTPLFHQFVAVRCKATVQTAVVRGPLSRAVGLSTKGSELAPCKILLEAESPEILFISKGSNLRRLYKSSITIENPIDADLYEAQYLVP